MSYIKKLVIHGFKSFPKKTEILFTPGINVILGPNGSGKSNVSDAICFALGRLSIKSMRAAKASNLIFLGSKIASPAKEASVELIFDNSQKTFSLNSSELSLKRIVRRNGQSIYKINNETKTRQEVLSLLAQAGVDPQGFNIILQGEIQNFVRMQPEDRRGIIEEVSGISIYESRKEKSLKELDKTDERLKEIGSILRERTAYLNNLERERQQALRFKKIESYIKSLKASIIHFDLSRKKKEIGEINSKIERKNKEVEKIKSSINIWELEIKNIQEKIEAINKKIQRSTGIEQETLNSEIANLRAELAGLNVKLENYGVKLASLNRESGELKINIKEFESSIKSLSSEPVTTSKKTKELEQKKDELERIEEQRKKFYMLKSQVNSLRERISDKKGLLQSYNGEAEFLIKQIENSSIEIFDLKSSCEKLKRIKVALIEKKGLLSSLLKRELELEKNTSINESKIENQNRIIEKISKMDLCPVCKNKITEKHMQEIKSEIMPKIEFSKKEIMNADKELKSIYEKKEIITRDLDEITEKISRTESDLSKLSNIGEKKLQVKNLHEKSEMLKKEISELIGKLKNLEKLVEDNQNIDEKYDNLKIDLQEISLRTKETVGSEVTFKERELERMKISLKQNIREETDLKEKLEDLKKIIKEKENVLSLKRNQEAQLSEKFQKFILERDGLHKNIRKEESINFERQHGLRIFEQEVNDFKIEKARVGAEEENLEAEMSEFIGIGIIKVQKDQLIQRLNKSREDIQKIGSVNLRSLEVYDTIKQEYDSIRDKSEIIVKEKEKIIKVIHEIDIKKKKAFLQTLKTLNELFSRNFSQLSTKGNVYLELDNNKDPFESGSGVQIIVKTGHGKYFDVKSLSGGEQTLVALSLIFAIQEYRPYYFYLLDEIDAALDKRNSERLASLLNKYMQNGQYIIITHNDEVISKATNLYGISMHDGISKMVSLKL